MISGGSRTAIRRHFTETADEGYDRSRAASRAASRTAGPLPPELERRIDLLEADAAAQRDFDARSWLWLILLGVVLPVVLLILGWSLPGGRL
jgi:hypothetical protein